jgi:hypothetical protein
MIVMKLSKLFKNNIFNKAQLKSLEPTFPFVLTSSPIHTRVVKSVVPLIQGMTIGIRFQ